MYVVYSIRADLLQLLSVAFSGSGSTVGCRRIWGIVNTRSRGQHTQSSRPLTLAWGEDSRIIGDVSMEYKMHESFRHKKRNQLFVSLMTKNGKCNVYRCTKIEVLTINKIYWAEPIQLSLFRVIHFPFIFLFNRKRKCIKPNNTHSSVQGISQTTTTASIFHLKKESLPLLVLLRGITL